MSLLSNIVGEVAQALFVTIADSIKQWWHARQLKKAEAKAATLEARIKGVEQAREVEATIESDQGKVKEIKSWDAWKKSLTALVLLSACFLASCLREGYAVSEMPIITVKGSADENGNGIPDWADKVDTTGTLTKNEQLLLLRIQHLETAITSYNDEARRINAKIKEETTP